METLVSIHTKDCTRGALQAIVSWEKPQEIAQDDWRNLLEAAWASNPASTAFLEAVCSRRVAVQEAWDDYMCLLHDMFSRAFQNGESLGVFTSGNGGNRLSPGAGSRKVRKGCLPKWTARSWARSGNSGQAGN